MLPIPPIVIDLLSTDSRWQIAFERFRSPERTWTFRSHLRWDEWLAQIITAPCSFSIVEATIPDAAEWVRRIARVQRLGVGHRVAVVGPPELASWSDALREAGAIGCAFTIAECQRLTRILERFAEICPPKPMSLRESIFAMLPWGSQVEIETTKAGNDPSDGTPGGQ